MTATVYPDVLIVDDSTAIRKILQRFLRLSDLPLGEIHEAGDGAEAIEILKSRGFGLVLSDLNMPGMDGFGLLAKVKEIEHMRNVPVVLITTEDSQGNIEQAMRLGAAGYIRKPFTAEQIREELAGVL